MLASWALRGLYAGTWDHTYETASEGLEGGGICFRRHECLGDFTVRTVSAFDEKALRQLLDAWRSKHPHIGGMPDEVDLLGQRFSFKGFHGLPGFVSAADAAEHNAAIDRYFAEYETFLKLWPAALNYRARILKFDLFLENTGNLPADDIDLQIWTEANGVWLEELPRPPKVPKPRNPYDFGLGVHMPIMDRLATNSFLHQAANEDGPNISGDDSKHRVQYSVKRVKHHVPCHLPIVYFQFDSDADVGSFTVNVRLVAANIRTPKITALHVEVTRATPVAPPIPGELSDEDED